MHSTLAVGERSLRVPTTLEFIEGRIRYLAKHFQVKLFHFAIESNHLHLVVMAPEKKNLSGFMSSLAGIIARNVLKAEKGHGKKIKFWSERPYSRVLSWGRELRNVIHYVQRNVLEARRSIQYTPRSQHLGAKAKFQIEKSLKEISPQLSFPLVS